MSEVNVEIVRRMVEGEGTLVTIAQFEATLNGTVVFVSANGDELTGTFSGFVSTLTGQIGIEGPITGRTGRFEDATGFFGVRGSQETEVEALEVREQPNATSMTPAGSVPTGIADVFSHGVSRGTGEPQG